MKTPKPLSPHLVAGEKPGAKLAFDIAQKLRTGTMPADHELQILIAALDRLWDTGVPMEQRKKDFARVFGLNRQGRPEPSGQSTEHEFAAVFAVVELMRAKPALTESAATDEIAQRYVLANKPDISASLPKWMRRHREAAVTSLAAAEIWARKQVKK